VIFEQGVMAGGGSNVCYVDNVCLIHVGKSKTFMSYDFMEWFEKGALESCNGCWVGKSLSLCLMEFW
jgi:hypothetical protein